LLFSGEVYSGFDNAEIEGWNAPPARSKAGHSPSLAMIVRLVRIRPGDVGAVYTSVLATGIGIAQIIVERVVRPVALYFPAGPVGEAHVRASECPRALICILCAGRIVPGVQLRIGPRFRQFMSCHV